MHWADAFRNPRTTGSRLPPFVFPVMAWSPEPASGNPRDNGLREFLTPDALTRACLPEDLRRGWTFVDAEGSCWEAVSSTARPRGPWLARAVLGMLDRPTFRLDMAFAERPPMSFDQVKNRLLAAVTANPEFYDGWWARERRRELRVATSLRDLIKSTEEWAIERLGPPEPLAWQWLLGDDRCTRSGFLGALLAAFVCGAVVIAVSPPTIAMVTATIAIFALVLSAVVRRLHDLGRSGWWLLAWGLWAMACALIHAFVPYFGGLAVGFWLWWIPSLVILGWLALWPGTPGPNRFGHAKGMERRGAPRAQLGGAD